MAKKEKKEVRFRKIPLSIFLDALTELYNEGLDYIDIVGVPDEIQDVVGITFTTDYMSDSMREAYTHMEDELKKEFRRGNVIKNEEEENEENNENNDDDDIDLNQLI